MNTAATLGQEAGRPLVGTWVKIPSLLTFEIVSQSSFDFVVIDLEHSPIGADWVHTACAVAQPRGLQVLVRMPDASGRDLQRVLDLGVDGVVIPQLHNAAETEAVISSAMFPPLGRRGMGLTSRAGRWGTRDRDEYMQAGDRSIVRCIQFETAESFENLEEMLGVHGATAALLGPADLAVNLGVQPGATILDELSTRLIQAADARSTPCGIAVSTPDQAEVAIRKGFGFVVVSNDATTFAMAIGNLANESRSRTRQQIPSGANAAPAIVRTGTRSSTGP